MSIYSWRKFHIAEMLKKGSIWLAVPPLSPSPRPLSPPDALLGLGPWALGSLHLENTNFGRGGRKMEETSLCVKFCVFLCVFFCWILHLLWLMTRKCVHTYTVLFSPSDLIKCSICLYHQSLTRTPRMTQENDSRHVSYSHIISSWFVKIGDVMWNVP